MPTTITAAVLRARGQPYALESLRLVDPGRGQVLVRIRACGICHTDVGVQMHEQGLPLPQVLGHEGAGEVVAVGEGVSSVAPGDHVVLSYASCGMCPNCADHAPQYCASFMALNYGAVLPDGRPPMDDAEGPVFGAFFGQSSFATHALALERNTVKVDDGTPWEILAPFGCGMQTGAGTVINSIRPRRGSSLAIIGTGSVGLAALMAAKDAGCSPLIAIDNNLERLHLAVTLGATHTLLASADNPTPNPRSIVEGGIDHIIDTTGNAAVLRAAVEALATRGELVMLAVTAPGVEISFAPNHLLGGKRIRGLVEGDSDPQTFIPELLAMHRAGRFPHDRLITTYPLDRINDAVADMNAGRVVKPVLLMG